MRTYAGPIVRVTVTKPVDGGFEGTVHPDDNLRLYFAGVPECPHNHVGVFHEHCVSSKEEFLAEDKSRWIVRDRKIKQR